MSFSINAIFEVSTSYLGCLFAASFGGLITSVLSRSC